MAGRLGCGGGPRERAFPPFAALCEPEMLQEGERDHRQQRVMVQPGPGAALEVVEAELLFHLLMRLLARPARLDRRGECLERRLGGMAGQGILGLATGTPLAD